jgi:hypothetical protein
MSISVVGDGLLLSSKGDLVVADGTAEGRLAVGTDGQILTASSTDSLGVKWINQPSLTYGLFPIAYANLTATSATGITFSNIPQTYDDLRIISGSICTGTVARDMHVIINSASQTASHYSAYYAFIDGTASAAESPLAERWLFPKCIPTTDATGGTNLYSFSVLDIKNYSSSTITKTGYFMSGFAKNSTSVGYYGTHVNASLGFTSTTEITSVRLTSDVTGTQNLSSGSWSLLLGIKR